ncbi:UNVERIFIED_CONTAM: ATP-dependent helicase, partial [Salmonella enterica subsp. enterica serovar Weltevreden]
LAVGSAAGVEEERRLFYVALTRARHALSVVVPRRFFVTEQRALGDRHVHAPASRFLTEAARACFDPVAPGAAQAG